jgi:hypothetical protein
LQKLPHMGIAIRDQNGVWFVHCFSKSLIFRGYGAGLQGQTGPGLPLPSLSH